MADINLQQEVFQGITNIVEAAIQSIHFDRTYPAIVTEIVDSTTGKYRVRYEDTDVVAYARDIGTRYRVNDQVYVQEPAVHSEATDSYLQIVSKVSNTNLTVGELQELTNWSAAISPNLINVGSAFGDGLIAGVVPESKEKSGLSITNFDKYLAATRYMRIDAEFMTHLQSEHYKGNYGLKLYFTASDGTEATYNFDLKEFNGTPYAFNQWAPQSAIFEVPAGIKNLKKIEFFQTGFDVDKEFDKSTTSWADNTTKPNLFVQNVGLYFVNKKDLTEEPYYIYINTPEGRILSEDKTSVELQAKLLTYGEGVEAERYVWYQRDLSVAPGTDWYDSNLGSGWKEIGNSNTNELTITSAEVGGRNQLYRVKAIYNSSTFVSDPIEIIDEGVTTEFTITQRLNEDKEYELYIDNLSGDEVLLGNWYATYIDNSYNVLDTEKNSIVPSQNGIYYIEVLSNESRLGYATYTYTYEPIEGDQSDIIVIWTGQDSYLYNANGMVDDYTMVERGRTISATVTLKDGVSGSIISTTMSGPTGTSLIKNFASAPDGLSATYNIAQNYDINATDNRITLTIVTTEKEYIITKDIIFVRNGDPGTNGTNYLIYIRPVKKENSVDVVDDSYKYLTADNSIQLGAFVYKSGDLVPSTNYTITWSSTGENIQVDKDTGEVSRKASITDTGSFVTAVITLKNIDIGRILTTYYPIDVQSGTGEVSNYNSVLKYIRYNSAGYNPEYDSTPLPEGVSATYMDNGNINVLNEKYLLPASSYISDGRAKAGYVKLGGNIIHSIVMYLNIYENESINGWDGQKVAYGDNYIYAPQIAAGRKHDGDNSFSGVVLGTGVIGSNEPQTGLYGFKNGAATYGFREDGTAFIGAATKGRINFDGENSRIYGGDSNETAKKDGRMILDLVDNSNDHTDKAIQVGTKFSVDYNGNLVANDGEFTGAIKSGSTISLGNGNFIVDNNGNVHIGGNLKFESGSNISWGNQNPNTDSGPDIANGTYSGGQFISGRTIYSPTIYTEDFIIYPPNETEETEGTFRIMGKWRQQEGLNEWLRIGYYGNDLAPQVVFSSPGGATLSWTAKRTEVNILDNGQYQFSGGPVRFLNNIVLNRGITYGSNHLEVENPVTGQIYFEIKGN